MIKNIYIATALIFSGLFLFACEERHSKDANSEVVGKKIADPIIYEVVVNNPDPEDIWKEECLACTNIDEFVKDVLDAVQAGKLIAYDYYSNERLSVEKVQAIIKKERLTDKIGNIQFEEEWRWDKNTLKLQKHVKKIMFGYEVYNTDGSLRGYKASFIVDLESN